MGEAMKAFRAAIHDEDMFSPTEIVPDGKLHRFGGGVNLDPDDNAGWYVYQEDGVPAGVYGHLGMEIIGMWRWVDLRRSPSEKAAQLAHKEETLRGHAGYPEARERSRILYAERVPRPGRGTDFNDAIADRDAAAVEPAKTPTTVTSEHQATPAVAPMSGAGRRVAYRRASDVRPRPK